MKNILVISSYLNDTYSTIEDQQVRLSSLPESGYRFVWLVRDVDDGLAMFKDPSNRGKLSKPVFVGELEKHKVEYVYGNISKFNILHNYRLIRSIVKKYKIDGVMTHFGFERYYGIILCKLMGLKTIYYEHMNWLDQGPRFIGLKYFFFRNCTDRIIAVSRAIAGTFPTGCRINTVYNALDLDKYKDSGLGAAELRQKLNLPGNKKIVLMMAAFREDKRHDLALEIAGRILAERQDVFFVFAGFGDLYEEVRKKVESRELEEGIFLPGHVQNGAEYFEACDLTMLTAPNEAFGNVVIESFIKRKPAVVFDSGGPSEIVEEGVDGFKIPLADLELFVQRIRELLDNAQLRETLGENGRKKVLEKFNYDLYFRNIFGILESVFGNTKERHE